MVSNVDGYSIDQLLMFYLSLQHDWVILIQLYAGNCIYIIFAHTPSEPIKRALQYSVIIIFAIFFFSGMRLPDKRSTDVGKCCEEKWRVP